MKILIVDDSRAVRDRVRSLPRELPNVTIIGETSHADGAIEMIRSARPDVVLLDFALPDGCGLDVLRKIKRDQPAPLVVMMSFFAIPEMESVCLLAGADRFLHKSDRLRELADMLRAMMPLVDGRVDTDASETCKERSS